MEVQTGGIVWGLAKDYGGKVKETCEIFNVSRSTFFSWKRKYDKYGARRSFKEKKEANTYPNRINQKTVDLILDLRRKYKLGT